MGGFIELFNFSCILQNRRKWGGNGKGKKKKEGAVPYSFRAISEETSRC